MKLLLVEDDSLKATHLRTLALECFPHAELTEVTSVHSARDALRDQEFDLILMDMSLNTYEAVAGASPGLPQPLGGRELIGYLDFNDSPTPVIVVTQYPSFTTGDEELGLEALSRDLESRYPDNFRGIVHYASGEEAWRDELKELIYTLQLGTVA